MDFEPADGERALERVFPPRPAPGPWEGWTTGFDGEYAPLPMNGRMPTWRDLTPRWIEASAEDLPLHDDAALRFYLPALLDHVARGRDSGRVGDALALALSPGTGADLALRGLTLLQVRELVAFLSVRESRTRSREESEAAAGALAHWRGIERATARRVRMLWIASFVLIPMSIALAVLGDRLPIGVGWVGHVLILAAGLRFGVASYWKRSGTLPLLFRAVPDHIIAFLGAGFLLAITIALYFINPDSFGSVLLVISVSAATGLAMLGAWRRGQHIRRREEREESANGG